MINRFENLEQQVVNIWNSQTYKTKKMQAIRDAYIRAKRSTTENALDRLERTLMEYRLNPRFTKKEFNELKEN